MKEIRGSVKNIRALLSRSKFSIDYYQREYRWEKTQVDELLDDFCDKFLESYNEGDERSAVEGYSHYFLGSIIISDRDGKKFIIDGQQRLTTLTLLLIHIYHRLEDNAQKYQLTDLIFTQKFGKRSFNIDVEERAACMNELIAGNTIEERDQPPSVVNMLSRYEDIQELEERLSENQGGNSLAHFADWLIENVCMVEITASTDTDAYTIFETINDRGLSLTPTDMLKGYLLANITDVDYRNKATEIWRDLIAKVQALGKDDLGKDEDGAAIKSWLRGQHALPPHERASEDQPQDFSRIGTEFHRWVRDNKELLSLHASNNFFQFIKNDFTFYVGWYERIRQAAKAYTQGLEGIFYNAQNIFAYQYPVFLAPLMPTDNEQEVLRKLRIVSTFLDILVTRRLWNWRSINSSTMQNYIFQQVILNIRRRSAAELVNILTQYLKNQEAEGLSFATNDKFGLTGRSRWFIRNILARITEFIEIGSGMKSNYADYIKSGKNSYEVEHIWANHPERFMDEFDHMAEFTENRNHIGGLLLLPKDFNAAFGDKPYSEKYNPYFGQNILAKSLHENAYEKNPGFLRFKEETGLKFQPHPEFKRTDLDARQKLYQSIAEKIWDPAKLQQELQ